MRLAAGTRTSSKWSSAVGEPRIPILCSRRGAEKPGVSVSTMKALSPLRPGVGIGHGEDGDQVGDRAVGDEALAAVEQVVVAVTPGAHPNAGHVAAGARLGQAEGGDPLPAGQAREVARLLLLAARDR